MSEGVSPSPKGTFLGFPIEGRKVLGGLIIAGLAAALLIYGSFVRGSTTVPQIMAAVLIVVGLAIAIGILPVQAPQDVYGGLVLAEVAILALIASADLPGQRGFAFGPGTAPRLFSIMLAALGAVVALSGVFAPGPRIEKYKIRGPVLVIVSILLFAAMIRPLGLVPASFITFLVAISGSKEMRLVESLVGAVAMTAFCVVLFVYLLNLPFQLWPRFF
jgi:putative tricarboxylic transport membrane protein